MRVISGEARGIKLEAPAGLHTRPTSDRLKENLFNLLRQNIKDARVLDLFAGSGAIGVEALSRGADEAVFVEADRNAVNVINANLLRTRLSNRATVLTAKVRNVLTELNGKNKFDIIYLDPPYSGGLLNETIQLLDGTDLLNESGIIAAELPANDPVPETKNLLLADARRYGNKQIIFYKRAKDIIS